MVSLWKIQGGKILVGVGVLAGFAAVGITWYMTGKRTKKISRVIDMIDEFKKPTVHIRDRSQVEELVCLMIQGGREKLQVIADFDRTITCFKKDGKLVPTCHMALDGSKVLPDFFREQAANNLRTYYPIEIDPKLTIEEKIPYMVEWWTKAHSLLVSCNLTKNMLEKIVRDANIYIREGSDWLFQQLHKNNVPLLIFSAGVGDIIEMTISQQTKLYSNIKIVSNYMDFNHVGNLVGFKGEMIHIYNKNESVIHKSDYFEKIQQRENIILLGDSVGDVSMAEGANSKNVLKIGFLNDKIEERMKTFLELYDIVLVGDETMDIVNGLLKKIL